MNDVTQINPADDVLIALRDCHKGEVIEGITLLSDIKQGHKIALHDMPKGHLLIKYGNVIGILSKDVKKGEWIHSQNLVTSLNTANPQYSYRKSVPLPPMAEEKTFLGYPRKDGRIGTRNDLFIVPTVGCVNGSCNQMKAAFLKNHPKMVEHVHVLVHPYGCSQLGDDLSTTQKLLIGLAKNPDAGATLVVGLGCENNRLSSFMTAMEPYDHERVLSFQCQDVEDDIAYGVSLLDKLYEIIKVEHRVPCLLSGITLGLKCGGSDGLSGLTANPLVGLLSDALGASGAKVALTEVPEMFGAEQALMNRATNEKTFEKTVHLIEAFKAYYAKNGQPCYENPSPGNKDGGITTLEEKSSGCILKGGHLEIMDVIDVGDQITQPDLTLVNGPGNDIVAATNLAAAGANIIVFTTGRGTPYGSIIPTIKIATNHDLSKRKPSWIDFDGEKCLDEGFEKAKEELLDLLIEVASGKETAEETHDMGQIALFKTGVTL
jgi:altronate hydrolase